MAEKLAPEKRHAFVHNGQKVFEWDQTLDEVNMYIELPKGVPTKLFRCTIQAGHVKVGISGNPPYLNHDLTYPREDGLVLLDNRGCWDAYHPAKKREGEDMVISHTRARYLGSICGRSRAKTAYAAKVSRREPGVRLFTGSVQWDLP